MGKKIDFEENIHNKNYIEKGEKIDRGKINSGKKIYIETVEKKNSTQKYSRKIEMIEKIDTEKSN